MADRIGCSADSRRSGCLLVACVLHFRLGWHDGEVKAMHSTATRSTPSALIAAFRDVHRPRLLAFTLVYLLGDRARAERATDAALAAAAGSVEKLRHPERAAAWLRHHIVRSSGLRPSASANGQAAMARIGIGASRFAGLSALDPCERAALLANDVEGLDFRDVATVVGCGPRSLERLLERARRKYVVARAKAAQAHHPSSRRRWRFAVEQRAARMLRSIGSLAIW